MKKNKNDYDPLLDEIIDGAVRCNDFSLSEKESWDGKNYVELTRTTPEGEDWHVCVWYTDEPFSFVEAMGKIANEFNVDEEAAFWISKRGQDGVPYSVIALLRDAEWKKKALQKLASDLEFLKNSYLNK